MKVRWAEESVKIDKHTDMMSKAKVDSLLKKKTVCMLRYLNSLIKYKLNCKLDFFSFFIQHLAPLFQP